MRHFEMSRGTEYLTLEKLCANLIVNVLSGNTLLKGARRPHRLWNQKSERNGRYESNQVFFILCLIYCVSAPSFSEAGCTWQLSRALPVPLKPLCCRMWHFPHLLAAEFTRNWGNLNVLAVLVLPAGTRKLKCWNFTVNGELKSIVFCSDKTRILVLAETKMKALNKLMQ